jgi:predicted metal-dependent phosphoesterase TrpH
MPVRNFRKNAHPGFYNLRFKPSYGRDNIYFHSNAHIHGANGSEDVKTDRNPTTFKFSNNLFKNDILEWKTRGADYLYQISSRLHRSNDGWTRSLFGYTGFCFMMFAQAPIWKIHFFAALMCTAARIRDKGAEPTIDEVWVLD